MGAQILRNERTILEKSLILDPINEEQVRKSVKDIERVTLAEY